MFTDGSRILNAVLDSPRICKCLLFHYFYYLNVNWKLLARNCRTRFWINQGLANVHWWFTNVGRGFGLTKDLQMFTILLFLLLKCKSWKLAVRNCRTRFWINQGLANVHWWFTNVGRGFGLTKDLKLFTISLFLLFKCKPWKLVVRDCRTRFWINQGRAHVHWWFTKVERGFGLTKEPQVVSDPAVG